MGNGRGKEIGSRQLVGVVALSRSKRECTSIESK